MENTALVISFVIIILNLFFNSNECWKIFWVIFWVIMIFKILLIGGGE